MDISDKAKEYIKKNKSKLSKNQLDVFLSQCPQGIVSEVSIILYSAGIDVFDNLTTIYSNMMKDFSKIGIKNIFVVPDNIRTIDSFAFQKCSIENVEVSGRSKLSANSFAEFNGTTVTLKEGIREIPRNCFIDCDNLTAVYLPESLERIGAAAFIGCPPELVLYGKKRDKGFEIAVPKNEVQWYKQHMKAR